MGGLIVAAVCFAYLAVSFAFARKAYRHEYQLVYGSPAPQIYGGRHGHDKAREVALREASQWLAMWPFYCAWAMIEWLIAHGIRQGWVEVANEITQMQTEVDRLAAEQDPSAYLDLKHGPLNEACECGPVCPGDPCPCGYVTECHIWCGDGSCHREDPWLWDDNPEIIMTSHPEKIRVYHTEAFMEKNAAGEIIIDEPGCGCQKCRPELYLWTGARWVEKTPDNMRKYG